jgi:outer membrane immunogenic protein
MRHLRTGSGVIMRRLLIGISISLGTVASVTAADLPIYTKAPIPAATYNWTGFYLGGNIGYSWGSSDTTASLNDPGGVPPGVVLASVNPGFNLDGVIGGGQVGYNRQAGQWVFGIEADLQATGQSGGTSFGCRTGICAITTNPSPGAPVTDTLGQKLEWLDTVRGRIGVTFTPTILGYVTGGLAYGGVNASGTVSGTNGTTPVIGPFSSSATHSGWTIGGGIEAALGGKWTGKIEYLYVDLGTVSGGAFVTPIVAPSGAFLTGSFSSHITDNILRVGLNYRF